MSQIIGFFFSTSWRQILLAAITSSCVAGLNILSVRFMSQIIVNESADKMYLFGIVAISVTASTIIGLISGKYLARYYENLVSKSRSDLAQLILLTNYEINANKLDRIVALLLFEISTIENFGKNISGVIVATFQIVVVVAMMFSISWMLTLMVCLIFIIAGIFNFLTLNWFKSTENQISKIRFKLHFNLDRFEKGLKDLSLNSVHGDKYVESAIKKQSDQIADLNVRAFHRRSIIESFTSLFTLLSFGGTLVYAILYADFSTANLVEFLALVLFIIPSFSKVTSFLKDLKIVENALDQIASFDIDFQKGLPKDNKNRTVESDNEYNIGIKDLCYEYPGKNGFKLGPVSLAIQSNTITIIKGGNGSGKSTLFNIITGLYEATSGIISHNNNALGPKGWLSLKENMSCIYTESPVFEDLSYIKTSKSASEIKELINYLELEGKTAFDSQMQIEEVQLSQGQKGRLNLMRILIEDKPICLFDEWAANQDVEFRKKFYTQIIPELKRKGKTIIMISHDEKYYDIADQVVTLKNGQIV